MRKFTATMLAVLLLAATAGAVGEKAPDFTLTDLQGKTHRLADMRGKVVVISFWMTWCAPCKMEMPHLKRLHETYQSQGLEVWSITADSSSDVPKVRSIVRRYQLTNPVLLDTDSRVTGLLNPRADYPLTIVVDKQGAIAWVHIGYQPGDEKELEAKIQAALGAS